MSGKPAIENLILISTCEKLIWCACLTKDGPTLVLPPFFLGRVFIFLFFFSRTLNGEGRNYCTLNGRGHNSAGHYMPADEILILISCWTLWTHG